MCNMCPMGPGPGVNVWFTCKPCRNYFVKVQDFIQHKQKFHFQDFHQFITFEEATDWDPNLSSFSTLPMNEDDPDLTCDSTTRAHDLYLDSLGLLFWFACKLCDSFFLSADDLVEHVKKTHNTFNENQKKTGFIILEERTDANQNNNWFSLTSPKETIDKNTQENFLISQPSVLPSSENNHCNLSIKSSSIISSDTDIINFNTSSTKPCHETQPGNFYLQSLVEFDNHHQPNDNNLLVTPPGSQHTEAVRTTEKVSGILSTEQFSSCSGSGSDSDILRTRLTLEQTRIPPTNINPIITEFILKQQKNEFQDQVKVQQKTNNNRSSKIFKCLHTVQFQIPTNVHYQNQNESAIHQEIGNHTSSESRSINSENKSNGKLPYVHFDCYMGEDAEPLPVPVPVPVPVPIPVVPILSESVTIEILNKTENELQLKQNTIPEFPELSKNKYGDQQQQVSDQPVGHATTLLPAQTNNVILNRGRGHQRKCRKRNKPSKHEIRSGDTSSSDLNHNYYKCRYPTCKKRFKTNLALQNHAFYHTVDPHRIFPCPRQNCNLTFKSETDLFDHLPVHTPEVKYFFCLHHNCGKSFRYNYQLKEHFKNNHYWSPTQTTGPFRCPRPALQHCRDLLFKTQWHLKVHLENSSVHNSNSSKKPAASMDQNQNQLKIPDESKPTADSRSISNLGSIITIPKSELSAVSKVDGSETQDDDGKINDMTDPDADLQGKQPGKIEDTDNVDNHTNVTNHAGTKLDCGSLIKIPEFPTSLTSFQIHYKSTGAVAGQDQSEEGCLWTLDNTALTNGTAISRRFLFKVNITLFKSVFEDEEASLAVIEWHRNQNLSSHLLIAAHDTYASNQLYDAIYLSFTSTYPTQRKTTGFVARIDIVEVERADTGLNFSFRSLTGSQKFGPYLSHDRVSIVVHPKTSITLDSAHFNNVNDCRSDFIDVLRTYEIGSKGVVRVLPRFCRTVTGVQSLKTHFPVIAVLNTWAETTSNGFSISWE